MKRFIYILLVLLFANANCVSAATNTKAELKAVKEVLKTQIQSANKYDYPAFVKHFAPQYINSDGFALDIYSKLVEDTWNSYSNIQYAQQIKNITIDGKDAIAEVIETANAQVESQYNLKGDLKSIANNIYFLRKTADGWKIVSDVILTEDTYLSFGEMVNHSPTLTVPYQTLANQNYTATLEYSIPKDTIAIASLNQEKITYPQENAKENYRKLPEDGILERFFTANNDNTNEYIIASVGLTRPVFDNKDLQINVTGIAYIIKRVNVVPENKFINREGVISVAERLQPNKESKQEEPVVEEIIPTVIKTETQTDNKLKKEKKTKEPKIKERKNKKSKETKTKESTPLNLQDSSKEEIKINEKKVKDSKDAKIKKTKTKEAKQIKEQVKKQPKVKQEKVKKELSEEKARKEALKAEINAKKEELKRLKEESKKQKKQEKLLKGAFSPSTVDIPTTTVKNEVE